MLEEQGWNIVGKRHHHGINVPLFSLRTANSCGIGEYFDLLPLIPWCRSIGFDVIQTLPLNDTGHDASPYSALSAFALNPYHLSLTQLPEVKGDESLQTRISNMQGLNELPRVDYATVKQEKDLFLKEYFTEHGREIEASRSFRSFVQQNPWLRNYCQYKALKEKNGWKAWDEWTEEDQPNEETILFQEVLQFLCSEQLSEVKRRAFEQGVFIKGDIPILLNKDSADVWSHPEFFILDRTVGAPPDMYSEEGQNWKFPLYNWEQMRKQGFQWWKQRLMCAESFYHLYRLDHIVGFFRLWVIPLGGTGKDGKFVPKDMGDVIEQGESILKVLLSSSSLLPIGEDLGVVPLEVKKVLHKLGVPGTKVMRWERYWDTDKRFIDPKDYDPISMTTVSTHDSDTLRLWWRDQPEEAEAYAEQMEWVYIPELASEQQVAILKQSHHSASLFHINLLQEYLTVFPELRWEDPADERINVPGIHDETNWTYKFKPSVEEFTAHERLAEMMRSLLK